jgi:hypothetical protein
VLNFGEGVAGDGDYRIGQLREGVPVADVGRGGLVGGCGEMDSMRGGGYGNARVGVDKEAGGVRRDSFQDLASEKDEVEGREVLFAELDEVDAFGGPLGGLEDEGGLLGAVVAGK